MSHSYPIAIGPGETSHEEVEQRFKKDLEKWSSGDAMEFFHEGLKCNVCVFASLFCSLMDQPERRSANFLMLGRSRYTAKWGIAMDFVAVASKIPACETCWLSILHNHMTATHTPCVNCVNWDTVRDNGLLSYSPP